MVRGLARGLVLLLTLVLVGCGGWRLRGYADAALGIADLAPVQVVGDLDSDTGRLLRRSLVDRDLLADGPAMVVDIGGVAGRRRAASFDADAEVAEFELEEELTLTILAADGGLLFGPERLAVERVYRYDPDEVIGSAEEQEQLVLEMRDDLVRRVLQSLSLVQRRLANEAAAAEAEAATTPAPVAP